MRANITVMRTQKTNVVSSSRSFRLKVTTNTNLKNLLKQSEKHRKRMQLVRVVVVYSLWLCYFCFA